MKLCHQILALLSLALCVSSAAAQDMDNANSSVINVTGEVNLLQPSAPQPERDSSKVVVWLVPVNAVQPVSLATSTDIRYRMVQHNKRFEPRFLVVPVGTIVDFPNADPWFHNVFSLYRGKRFDLGLYQAGSHKSVRFDRPGPSYLFCNIHPEMTGVVLAVDSRLFGISDQRGRYEITSVPAGKYVLHVWYENATPESLLALQHVVTVGTESRTLPAISVPVAKQTHAEHKNKYGQDYDPNTLKTDY